MKAQEQGEEEALREKERVSNDDTNLLNDVNLSETDILATEEQHLPLKKWFQKKQIHSEFDYDAVDMSGFYDEASETIGKHYPVVGDIIGRICWSYQKQHTGLNIDLTRVSQKEGQTINNICRTFYGYTLFSRYNYRKKDKNIHLKLQKASPVQLFFNGGWLEWFALTHALSVAKQRGRYYHFSCARNVKIRFANEDVHELDVVFLPNNKQPLIIECKSGEFRQDLDKYLGLRKRLKLPIENFILLVTNLDEAQSKSLSGMYDLTFANLITLPKILESLL